MQKYHRSCRAPYCRVKHLSYMNLAGIGHSSSSVYINNPGNSYFKGSKTTKYPSTRRRSVEKEGLAKEITEELDDDHSLGAFRTIVDKIPEQQIRIFISIIKDTQLTGKIKKNKGAMFISLAKAYARKNIIDLNFK